MTLDACKREIDQITNWQDKGYGKRLCNRDLPPTIAAVIAEANSPHFLRWLHEVTGEEVVPDPLLNGGGVHSSLPGGYLRMHTDFNVLLERPGSNKVALYRRLNLLLYLNRDWPKDGGGELLLYDQRIPPEANTMVVFTTDDKSWHGHPEPCTVRRDSIALYYYSPQQPEGFVEQRTTVYR